MYAFDQEKHDAVQQEINIMESIEEGNNILNLIRWKFDDEEKAFFLVTKLGTPLDKELKSLGEYRLYNFAFIGYCV
jgi:hypothetical protein